MNLSLRKRIRSFGYAFNGLRLMLMTQRNAQIHAGAAAVAVALGVLCDLSRVEWAVLVLTIAAVWAAEALNTAFEALCDVASPGVHPQVKRAKDIAAGAVLVCAIAAVAVAALILAPKLLAMM